MTLKMFKAIELDPATRQRTGREHTLQAETRHAAIDALLRLVAVTPEQARIDPSRTLVQVGAQLWTLVAAAPASPPTDEASSLRRAGAKHRRVR
jgi:hypothetical protein